MTTNITDVDEFTAQAIAPEDGDAGNGATFIACFQRIANRTRYLKNVIEGLLPLTPATVVRFVGAGYQSSSDASGNEIGWLHLNADPTIAVSIGSARAKRSISFDHVLPNGATITQVRARVTPVGAQTGTNRMSAQVFVGDITGTQYSSTKTYDSGVAAAQWITISGLSIVVDKTQRTYCVAIENASTFIADLICGAEITFTTTKKLVD